MTPGAARDGASQPDPSSPDHEPARAVTFDFGQTLAEMDVAMLARRLRECGVDVDAARLEAATPGGWRAYNDAVRAGHGGHPWQVFMRTVLEGAGLDERRDLFAAWLWDEQPRANLWRRPIPGMIELVRELRAAGVPVAVVSNSEGRLAALIAEMGWSDDLPWVADSGVLQVEKPAREIFARAAQWIDTPLADCVHIGDAWAADFVGALDAGMRAVLFRGGASVPADDARLRDPRAARCESPESLRVQLRAWGLPL